MDTSAPIARPQKCSFQVEEDGSDLVLRRRTGWTGTGVFLLFWLTGWTAGCVALCGMVIRQPTLEHILFAIPFWTAWFAVSGMVLYMLFGVERIRVGPDGVEYQWQVLVPVRNRVIPLSEIKGIAQSTAPIQDDSGKSYPCLKFEALGRPIRFGLGLNAQESLWLLDVIRRHLQGLRHDHVEPPPAKDSFQVERLIPGAKVPDPPSDCRIQMVSEWDRTEFIRKGTFSLTTLGGVTFVVLFWNGIVSVFIFQLFKQFQWFLFFFLIPFEAMGLLFIAAWLAALTAPFWVDRWTISPGEFLARFSIFGLGRTRRFEATELGAIALRKNAGSKSWRSVKRVGDDDTPYSLGIVSRDNQDLLTIENLTEGEARWLGGQFATLLKGTLPRTAPTTSLPERRADPLWDAQVDR